MTNMSITSASYGDMTNTVQDYSVSPQQTDGADGNNKETEYAISNWAQWLGYYKTIPELKAAIDAKATWTVGKGFQSNELTQLALLKMQGFGKDSFNAILQNMIRTYHIAGDSFAEIIRDSEGYLINLKPLDPGSMKIVANRQGLILRYEQTSKAPNGSVKKFQPDQILHLSRNRVADEIHGVSMIEAVETIILMRNEAMADYRETMHRYGKPRFLIKLDTDDTSKIAAFKTKADEAVKYGENIYAPMNTVEFDLVSIPPNATLSPLPWIQALNNYFFQAAGVPQIIVGGSQEITEATAKIAYLAFEQTIEEEQLYVEEQVLAQLNLEIELEFPASLERDMLTDQGKSETMQAATPEDTSAPGAWENKN